MVQNIVL